MSLYIIPPKAMILARWTIVLSLATLMISMTIGNNGISNYMELKSRKDELKNEIFKIQARNLKIQGKIYDLKKDPLKQEYFLRKDTGMMKKDEKIFRFEGKKYFQILTQNNHEETNLL